MGSGMWSPGAQAVAIGTVCLCAAIAHAQTEGPSSEPECPVRLLSIEASPSHGEESPPAEGLELSSEGLRYLKSLPTPLYIVPMLGVYRGGKSLLLNRLMGLSAPYPHGFGVGHGQETYTRGIHMCGEIVPDVGSVVWMDTEGLFSAEDARSAYGPKIFSLALLFSSMVLLNSVKVFNDQFFAYFGEQQQVARVLKQGLIAEGLPHGSLLPANLTVLWVLQQPVRFDAAGMATQQQLHTFLNAAGDEYRAHVQRDFRHLNFEVPSAAHDVRSWGKLDKLPDDELSVEYTRAVVELRATVLQNLGAARPLQPSSVAKQLQMYVQAVQTEQFSISLAREAFEEEQIGSLCDKYWRMLLLHAGQLPSSSLQDARSRAREELEPQLAAATVEFHFTSSWSLRAVNCWKMKEEELDKKNEEAVMKEWKSAATSAAQGGSCFFLRDLVVLLNNYTVRYRAVFSTETKVMAVDFASALQRARLVECVLLRDVLVPFVPWLAWPVLSFYMQGRVIGGLLMAAVHGVILLGLYAVLQMSGQLPGYLNIDYRILREHPLLLDIVMNAPPMVPWTPIIRGFSAVGVIWSTTRLLRHAWNMALSAGHGRMSDELVVLELKLNKLIDYQEQHAKEMQALRRAIVKQAGLLGAVQAQLSALTTASGVNGFAKAESHAEATAQDAAVAREEPAEAREVPEEDDAPEQSVRCPDELDEGAEEGADGEEEEELDDDEEADVAASPRQCVIV